MKTRLLIQVLFAAAVLIQASAAPAAISAIGDPGWPRSFERAGSTVLVHQPQIESWEDHALLKIKAAIEVTPKGSTQVVLGAVWLSAATSVNMDTRTVTARDLKVTRSYFPGASEAESAKYAKIVQAVLPAERADISLDRVLAYMEEEAKQAKQIQTDAAEVAFPVPEIFYSEQPAALVMFDGKPVWKAVAGTTLSNCVNTNWDLFQDNATKVYYLLLADGWIKADRLEGPWGPALELPKDFSNLPADDNWKNVRANVPGQQVKASEMPAVFVSERPAELIAVKGSPEMMDLSGTKLSYVANTSSDVFHFKETGEYYFLVSGRWFATKDLTRGPWRALKPQELPREFAKIPASSPKGPVLASVPGTSEANFAVLQAQIPQKAAIKRKDAQVTVSYAGEPQFEPISGTSMTYAVNTPYSVIKVDGRFYCCHNGVWFVADFPKGPWRPADRIPGAIYSIPPSSPVYPVTYVRVYQYTPDTIVFGYLPGYLGSIVVGGVVVFGTGFYYPPFVYGPVYFPRPAYFGVAAFYSPFTGLYNRGAVFYGPYGGWGCGGVYNPWTGTYARASAAWGPYGATGTVTGVNPYTGRVTSSTTTVGPYGGIRTTTSFNPYTGRYATGSTTWGPGGVTRTGMAYNPFTGNTASGSVSRGPGGTTANANVSNAATGRSLSTTQNSNGYAQWGKSAVTTPRGEINTGHYDSARRQVSAVSTGSGAGAASYQGPRNDGRVVKSSSGDLVVGNDGNIYKRQDGQWSKVDPAASRGAAASQGARQEANRTQAGQAQQARDNWQSGDRSSQAQARQARDNWQSGDRSGQAQAQQAAQQRRAASGYSRGEAPAAQIGSQLDRDYSARATGNERAERFNQSRRDGSGFSQGGDRFGGGGGGRFSGGGGFGGGGGRRR